MSANHTPLPWRVVVPPSSWLTYRFIEAETGEHIAKIGHLDYSAGRPADIANAAFIVRACNSHDELLEALRAVITASEIIDGQDSPPADNDVVHLHTVIKNARAAIAKAEGREP